MIVDDAAKSTAGQDYADRLKRLEGSRWRQVLNVQAPYRWNIRRLELGRTLDVGCGLGRNLAHLDGNGVGVDHNADAIETARAKGLTAYTVDEFYASDVCGPAQFDSMLLAHVVEHMTETDAVSLVREYLPCVRPGGRVCFITPQERGYATDATHIRFVDFAGLRALSTELGLTFEREYSFPFPRVTGKFFPYNEFVFIARLP